jgi:pimeloyl-ACP methyl ester carboxylesterase
MQTKPKCISLQNGTVHAWHLKRSEETIFFIHGYPGRPQDFKKLIEEFSTFSVLAVALPGFGITPGDNFEPITHSTLGSVCMELLEFLNIDKVHVVGHSFGGALACFVAVNGEHKTQSLTLISSIGLRPHKALRMGIKNAYKALSPPWLGWLRSLILPRFFAAAGFPKKLPLEAMWLSCRLVSEFSFSGHSDLVERIHCQTLIVHCKDDPLIEVEIASELKNKIKLSRLILLEDGKHNPQHTQSRTVAGHVKKMIEGSNAV